MLKTDEIGVVVREGKVENPIEVYDDSDEDTSKFEKYSVDGMDDIEHMSDLILMLLLATLKLYLVLYLMLLLLLRRVLENVQSWDYLFD